LCSFVRHIEIVTCAFAQNPFEIATESYRPCETLLILPSFPGTAVPGFHMPPLQGWGLRTPKIPGCHLRFLLSKNSHATSQQTAAPVYAQVVQYNLQAVNANYE
jgi:hypothetical protein